MFFPIELLRVPVSVGSLFLSYFFAIYFFNHRLYLRHVAMLSLFFKMPIEKNLWSILRFLVKLELFLTIFLPSKILLNNNIYEKSIILWAFYTVILSLFFWVFLIIGNVYFFSLSMLYFILHVEILVFALLIKNDFLKVSLLFSLGLSHQEFDEIVFFYLGNTYFKTMLSSVASFGTAGVASGAVCFQWARECANSTVAGDLFMDTSLAEIKASVKAHDLKLEQIKFDRIKDFEYYRSKDFSLEAAFSKAECLADKSYCSVREAPKPLSIETLSELVKLKGDVMDATLKKQPIHGFLDSYELKGTVDFSLKAKK
jgi:hypothetical protein